MSSQRFSPCAAILLILLFFQFAAAADSNGEKAALPPQAALEENSSTFSMLNTIIQSMDALHEQIKKRETELKAAASEDQKAEILEETRRLRKQLETLGKHLEGVATGVNLDAFESQPKKDFDLKQEIQDLLGPIIQELKSMTARPREIEKLRNEIAHYQKQAAATETAVKNIGQLIYQTHDEKLKRKLIELEKTWKDQQKQLANQLAVSRYQLEERLKEEKSFLDSTHEILRSFFKNRGKNFIFAFLAFISVIILLRLLRRYVYRLVPSLESSKRSFYVRLADVIYQLMIIVLAVGALILVLYALGDWPLLGLAILFLIGLAWAAKQSLPKIWQETNLLMNLGTVRENERLLYNGLPWKVTSLNFYTRLVNPELAGGVISLPLKNLVGMHSRPYHPNEPWFPCKEKDWVVLADGTRGRVLFQSPEFVQLVLLGGSRKTYSTEEFLKQNPQNISTNFRVRVKFGIDYRHQAEATREVPEKLRAMLSEELEKEAFGNQILSLKVEFSEAGASSLDLVILADFAGSAAKDYEYISRTIQKIAVEACNRYEWVIPFAQITVHNAEG